MPKLGEAWRRWKLGIGFSAAFLALLITLALQSWWLLKLEKTSAQAGKAVLSNFLEAVVTDVSYAYGPVAERVLDLPSSWFTQDRLDRAAGRFEKKEIEGVRRFFVVRFEHEDWGTILFYDPETGTMRPAPPSDEARAVTVACAPWKLISSKGVGLEDTGLVVEERDPQHRIILNPITDEASRVVGAAGIILDTGHFANKLLPETVRKALPRFFSGAAGEGVIVTLRDEKGTPRFSTGEEQARQNPLGVLAKERLPTKDPGSDEAVRPLSFVFKDWELGVRSRGMTAEQWAHAGFVFNVMLLAVAAVLLAGGLGLALRTASHEVKLSKLKSDFVSNVSHELRTPLASICVFGEFLRMGWGETPEKVREYGAYIESESRRLTQLINNILDFAKIESGQKAYNFEPASVEEVLARTLRTFDVRLRQSGYEVVYEGPGGSLPPARIDADALEQAVHNLLDNAVNYSGTSRRIAVKLAQRNGEIVISVRDHGIGISKEDQEKIFDRFHRVGTGLVHDVRGSGLGLSIVQHIVRAHEGSVRVESEPGKGSTFTIHLPAGSA